MSAQKIKKIDTTQPKDLNLTKAIPNIPSIPKLPIKIMLDKITNNQNPQNSKHSHKRNISVNFKKITPQKNTIWNFLTEKIIIDCDTAYLTRLTEIDGKKIELITKTTKKHFLTGEKNLILEYC